MRQLLPAALKSVLGATPQWLAISLPAQRPVVDVILCTAGEDFDITDNNAVAALRPFTIRLGFDDRLKAAIDQSPESSIQLVDRLTTRVIGTLTLKHLRDWRTADAHMGLFEVTRATHYCAHRLRKAWDSYLYQRAARSTPSEKLLMPPIGVEQLMVFYLCPRPVFLVSVDDGTNSNIFPMDLVGALAPDRFTLALRNTSASVQTIKNAGRVALADVPGSACKIAYELGAHHKLANIDWDGLPFRTLRSKEYALPVPDIAPRVREVDILDSQTVGSHTLFVGRIRSEQMLSEGSHLCHTSVIHQRLRTHQKRPFLEA